MEFDMSNDIEGICAGLLLVTQKHLLYPPVAVTEITQESQGQLSATRHTCVSK